MHNSLPVGKLQLNSVDQEVSTGDILKSSIKQGKSYGYKSVSFCRTVRVLLIPTKEEYAKAGIYSDVWYNQSDFKEFQVSAMFDLLIYCKIHPNDLSEDDVKELYKEMIQAELNEHRVQLPDLIESMVLENSMLMSGSAEESNKIDCNEINHCPPSTESLTTLESCATMDSVDSENSELTFPQLIDQSIAENFSPITSSDFYTW